MERGTALVLGATGGIGGETTAALLRRGWRVRALAREPARAAAQWPAGLARPQWVAGDAMDAGSVVAAARGTSLIVHAVNPPGYRHWGALVLPMLESTIRAAEASRARIVLPGTVYNYGPDAFPDIAEDAPQHPATARARSACRWSNGCGPRATAACAPWSCGPAISSVRAPATTGSRRGW